jgi:hypothetical protein
MNSTNNIWNNVSFAQQSYESFCAQFTLLSQDFFSQNEIVKLREQYKRQDTTESPIIAIPTTIIQDNQIETEKEDTESELNQLLKPTVSGGIDGVWLDPSSVNNLQTDNYVEQSDDDDEDDSQVEPIQQIQQFDYISTIEPFE